MKELKKTILGIISLVSALPLVIGFWIWTVTSILQIFGFHFDKLASYGLPLFLSGIPIAILMGGIVMFLNRDK